MSYEIDWKAVRSLVTALGNLGGWAGWAVFGQGLLKDALERRRAKRDRLLIEAARVSPFEMRLDVAFDRGNRHQAINARVELKSPDIGLTRRSLQFNPFPPPNVLDEGGEMQRELEMPLFGPQSHETVSAMCIIRGASAPEAGKDPARIDQAMVRITITDRATKKRLAQRLATLAI